MHFPHTTLLLGLQGQIRSTKIRNEDRTVQSEVPTVETDDSTQDTKRFSWGAAYTRDRFQITGASYSTLRLDNPFVALDARFFF